MLAHRKKTYEKLDDAMGSFSKGAKETNEWMNKNLFSYSLKTQTILHIITIKSLQKYSRNKTIY